MSRISIDGIDLSIIRELNSLRIGQSITTYKLAKVVIGDPSSPYVGRKNDNLIRGRLKKLNIYGLVSIIEDGGTSTYLLEMDNVFVKRFADKNLCISQKSYFLRINNQWFVFPESV